MICQHLTKLLTYVQQCQRSDIVQRFNSSLTPEWEVHTQTLKEDNTFLDSWINEKHSHGLIFVSPVRCPKSPVEFLLPCLPQASSHFWQLSHGLENTRLWSAWGCGSLQTRRAAGSFLPSLQDVTDFMQTAGKSQQHGPRKTQQQSWRFFWLSHFLVAGGSGGLWVL